MNLMPGGHGGFISEEQQRNRSLAANKARNLKMKTDEDFRLMMSKKISESLKKGYSSGAIKKNHSPTWNKGLNLSDTHKKNIGIANSIKQKGEKNSQFGTKWAWVSREGIIKKIKFDELKKYISAGWLKGRKK